MAHTRADTSGLDVGRTAVVFHFDRLAAVDVRDVLHSARRLLDSEPLVREVHAALAGRTFPERIPFARVVHQCGLFRLLRLHRPAIFARSDHYLAGADPTGWVAALVASGAATLPDVVELCGVRLAARVNPEAVPAALDRLAAVLRTAEIPVVSPDGVPLRSKEDLESATRAVLLDAALDVGVRRVHLDGDCRIVCLGSPESVDVGPFRADVIVVSGAADIERRRVNRALDEFEERSALA